MKEVFCNMWNCMKCNYINLEWLAMEYVDPKQELKWKESLNA